MSLRSALDDRIAEESEKSALELVETWYPVPVVGVLLAFMLWVRTQAYENFIVDGELYFRGNDPWWHLRETTYTVQNYPFTLGFDPWTGFPTGRYTGQFGTLFDQIAATAILLLTPIFGEQAADYVMLFTAPVMGALVIIPTYYLGKHFGGRLGGVFAALVLALLPGTFLGYTLVGFYDHHAGEVLFQAAAVLAFVVAVTVAEREKPVWELVVDRDRTGLETSAKFAALAGVGLALYMWVWPPGVLLAGIAGTYFLVAIVSDVANGQSPEPTAFVGAISMSVAGLLMLVQIDEFSTSPTSFGLLQVVVPLLVAVGSVFLAGIAREWETRAIDPDYYPPAVFGVGLLGLGLAYVVVPGFVSSIQSNLLSFVGFGQSAGAETIGEAQPLLANLQQEGVTATGRVVMEYGMTLFLGVAAAIWMAARPLIRTDETRHTGYVLGSLAIVLVIFGAPGIHRAIADAIGMNEQLFAQLIVAALILGATLQVRYEPSTLFLLVWAAFITSAAFTQTRFNYYLAVTVAVFNGYLVAELVRATDLDESMSTIVEAGGSFSAAADNVETWQVLTVGAILAFMIVPVLVVPVDVGAGQIERDTETAWEAGAATGPGPVLNWDDSLQWMNEETPYPGELEGHDNRMEYYGTYDWPEDDNFDYPDGAYGVQSWWDYGHWITTRAERIPNANPFQQGATDAANVLLAPSEERADEVLEEQGAENTRYVMIDWRMVDSGEIFGAPVVWYDDDPDLGQQDFYQPIWNEQFQQEAIVHDQRYYESLMVHLYEYHGSAVDPQPIVIDWEEQPVETADGEVVTIRTLPEDGEIVKEFDTMDEAREYVEEDGSAQVGGVGALPSERIPALEHYRLVKSSDRTLERTPASLTERSWVKTFERVPGADIEGEGPANATVTATVEMDDPDSGETFTYRQEAETDEDGEFSMTVPYASTGYEDYGPENGYTNVSVRATGPYTFQTELQPQQVDNETAMVQHTAEAHVSEGKVVGDDPEPMQVTLEEQRQEFDLDPDGDDDPDTEDAEEADDPDLDDSDDLEMEDTDDDTTDGDNDDVPI